MLKTSTIQIKRILLMQFTATIVISALLLVFNVIWFWSALIGGMTATLAYAYFAWKVFAKQETEPGKILATCYGAVVSKIVLTIMLFIAAIVMIKSLNIIALMGMYLFNQFTPVLVSFFWNDPSENRR